MATARTKSPRKPKRPSANDRLIEMMERMAPSKQRLRRLVKKHPAPQRWYDEDDQTPPPPQNKK
jgi:hypothetical protein